MGRRHHDEGLPASCGSESASLIATLCLLAACSMRADGAPTGSWCPSTNQPTYQSFGRNFMTSYCTGCHSSTTSDRFGAPADQNFDTDDDIRERADEIDMVAAAGPNSINTHMPQLKGPVLMAPSRVERDMLGAFLACEAMR